jgi:hypothetical protein
MSKIIAETRFQVIELDISQRGQVVKQLVKIPRSAARVKRITAMSFYKTGNYYDNLRFYGFEVEQFGISPVLALEDSPNFEKIAIESLSFQFSISAGATGKTYYAQPVRLGLVNLLIDGFQGGFMPPRTIPNLVTSTAPAYEQYYIWESNDFDLDATITVLPQ